MKFMASNNQNLELKLNDTTEKYIMSKTSIMMMCYQTHYLVQVENNLRTNMFTLRV